MTEEIPTTDRIRVIDITECALLVVVSNEGKVQVVSPHSPEDTVAIIDQIALLVASKPHRQARPE